MLRLAVRSFRGHKFADQIPRVRSLDSIFHPTKYWNLASSKFGKETNILTCNKNKTTKKRNALLASGPSPPLKEKDPLLSMAGRTRFLTLRFASRVRLVVTLLVGLVGLVVGRIPQRQGDQWKHQKSFWLAACYQYINMSINMSINISIHCYFVLALWLSAEFVFYQFLSLINKTDFFKMRPWEPRRPVAVNKLRPFFLAVF